MEYNEEVKVRLPPYRTIYRHLRFENEDPNEGDLRERYHVLREAEMMAYEVLPYGLVNNWEFTSHGIIHSLWVIRNINKILDFINEDEKILSETEVLLLYLSAWYHDIGMAMIPRSEENKARTKHGIISCLFLKDFRKRNSNSDEIGSLGTDPFFEALCTIIKSHNSEFKGGKKDSKNSLLFDDIKEHCDLDGESIHLKKLCSIFCLADGLDVGKQRVPRFAYRCILTNYDLKKKVKKIIGADSYLYLNRKSRKHWVHNMSTGSDILCTNENDCKKCVIILEYETEKSFNHYSKLRASFERYIQHISTGIEIKIIKKYQTGP